MKRVSSPEKLRPLPKKPRKNPVHEKSVAPWMVTRYWLTLLAVAGSSSLLSAQQSIAVQVSDSTAHVQYYDQAQINTPHCQTVMGQGTSVGGGGDQVGATS